MRSATGDRLATRHAQVDALRGFALWGIILVNVWAFADAYYTTPMRNPAQITAIDRFTRVATTLFLETKFYLLFSLLFGVSFVLQRESATRAGRAFLPRMLRRQSGLLVLGLVHGAVLYPGDILSTYAVLGLLLLFLPRLTDRSALCIAATITVTAGLFWVALGAWLLVEGQLWGGTPDQALAKATAYSGSALDTLVYTVSHLPESATGILTLQAPGALSAFLVGAVVGLRGRLWNGTVFSPRLRRVAFLGLPLGLGGSLAYALAVEFRPGGGIEVLAFGVDVLTAPLLTFAYVVGALALLRSRQWLTTIMAAPGRASLTNYLGQSLVLALVFTGFGTGKVGQVPPPLVPWCAVLIVAAQTALSLWWLRRLRYGPAEWVLRAWTTLSIPPMRATPAPAATSNDPASTQRSTSCTVKQAAEQSSMF